MENNTTKHNNKWHCQCVQLIVISQKRRKNNKRPNAVRSLRAARLRSFKRKSMKIHQQHVFRFSFFPPIVIVAVNCYHRIYQRRKDREKKYTKSKRERTQMEIHFEINSQYERNAWRPAESTTTHQLNYLLKLQWNYCSFAMWIDNECRRSATPFTQTTHHSHISCGWNSCAFFVAAAVAATSLTTLSTNH